MFLVKYYKEIILVAIVISLILLAIWVRGVVADNTAMKLETKRTQTAFEEKVKELDANIKLNKDISDAIKNLKIRSNNYITNVETSKPIDLPAGHSAILIPAGVPKTVPGVQTTYSSAHGVSTQP